jgi:hypothetical protein
MIRQPLSDMTNPDKITDAELRRVILKRNHGCQSEGFRAACPFRSSQKNFSHHLREICPGKGLQNSGLHHQPLFECV